MNSSESNRQCRVATLCLFLISSACSCGVITPDESMHTPVRTTVTADLVVLGRIDACWVCQNGPQPHVSYIQVLAGRAPSGQGREIGIVEVPARLLPQGGIPIYRSQRDEICYLTLVVSPADANTETYKVVDIEEATPENLAKFKNATSNNTPDTKVLIYISSSAIRPALKNASEGSTAICLHSIEGSA